MPPNPYDVLGVSPTATTTEIKRAYRALARQWHPDNNPDDILAVEQFRVISEAYHQLSQLPPVQKPAAHPTTSKVTQAYQQGEKPPSTFDRYA